MEILITERTDMTPLLGMDWMRKFKLTISKIQLAYNNQSEREKVFNKFPDLFENNDTIKDTETNIQLKQGHYPVRKARPIPLHLQEDVERELEKLIKFGHLEKINDVDEDCFVLPAGSYNSEKRQVGKKSIRLKKTERHLHQDETSHAQFGRTSKPNFG